MILFKKHVTTLEVFTTKKTKIYLNPHYALDRNEIQKYKKDKFMRRLFD